MVWRDGGVEQYIKMSPDCRIDEDATKYTAEYVPAEPGLYWYRFEFEGNWRRNRITMAEHGKGRIDDGGNNFLLTVYEPDFVTPEWCRGGIIYQIFPDRFYRSGENKSGVPEDRFLCDDWSAQPAFMQNCGKRQLCNDYYGGDLKGIANKLDYLSSLGVTIIYLNPIFEAHSNHRYNTADYFKVDPLLGTKEDFSDLCKRAGEYGIRIILDGVFSHTGDDSIYFDKYGRYGGKGAYSNPDSKYRDWYKFRSGRDDYHSWWGVPSLPEVTEETPSFTEFICGENGVLRYWMRLGASGWRLDVADELPDVFLDAVRRAIKAENPNALLIGEVWEDAVTKISYGGRRRFLIGRQLDSVMNYPFRSAIINFVKGGNSSDLEDAVMNICAHYPRPALDCLMNHIGTHDTVRILTELGGEELGNHDRQWQSMQKMSREQIESGKRRLKLAAALQFTLPGIPSIYYADEAGAEGYADPFNRAGFPWDSADGELTDFYKKLGKLRHENKAFAGGEFIPVYSHFGHIAYIRQKGDNSVLVAVNRWCDDAVVALPDMSWNDAKPVFGDQPSNGVLTVPAQGVVIIVKNDCK